MTKKRVVSFILILLLFISLYLFLNRGSIFTQAKNNPYEISVICRGQNSENWNTIKLGIDQAAEDLNADVSFITLSEDNNVSEQISLLNREIANGADAIVIAPVNSEDLRKPLEQAVKKVPVIAMQSTVIGLDSLRTVSCDNYQAGRSLAAELIKYEKGKPIIILRNSMGSSNIAESFRGISEALQQTGHVCSFLDMPDNAAAAYRTVRQKIPGSRGSVMIALDGNTLEAAATAKKDLEKSAPTGIDLYGIGITNTVVSLLENKVVNTVAVSNDYNIGYLCIKSAVDRINHKDDGNINVNYLIVNYSNMYKTESERMLFPFVR